MGGEKAKTINNNEIILLTCASRIFSYFPTDFKGISMKADVMTLRETAQFLRLTEKTAYRLAADGMLPGFKVGGSWRFRKTDIDAWIKTKKLAAGNGVRTSGHRATKTRKLRKGRRL
jgi:excisionase family DNA binding protein